MRRPARLLVAWMLLVAPSLACGVSGDAELDPPAPEVTPDHVTSTGSPSSWPPLPDPPLPDVSPGMYVFGQVFRYRDGAWTAMLPVDTDPVEQIFAVGDDLYVVSWTAVHRIRGDEVVELLRTPERPRLAAGWGSEALGVFAVGDSGSIFHGRGDEPLRREEVPEEALHAVNVSVTGADGRVLVGTSAGKALVRDDDAPWQLEDTPLDEVDLGCGDGRRAVFASEMGALVQWSRADGWRVESEAVIERDSRTIDEMIEGVAARGNHARISSLACAPDGTVWTVRSGEIMSFGDDHTWRHVELAGLHDRVVLGATEPRWILGGEMLRHHDGARWVDVPLGGASRQAITAIVERDGEVYVGTTYALTR